MGNGGSDSQRHVERRRYGRVPVKYRVLVQFIAGDDYQGTLLDLSVRGCRISSEEGATVGSALEVRIYPEEKQDPIRVDRAEVRWARDGEFGLEFMEVVARERERIRVLFESLAEGPHSLTEGGAAEGK